jgi:Flp pilus assembly protein TadG
MSPLRRSGFGRDRRGAVLTEFALTATALMLVIFAILQGGLIYWTWQALQGAAIDAARCAAINSSSCANVSSSATATQNYAVAAAALRGVHGATAVATTGTGSSLGCGTASTVVSVKLTYTMSLINTAYFTAPAMTAQACFPISS